MLERTSRFLFPLIFIPIDRRGSLPAGYLTALDTAVDAALAWWTDVLGFSPFAAAPAIAVAGTQPDAARCAEPNTQELIRGELAARYPELAGSIDSAAICLVYATLGDGPRPDSVIGRSSGTEGGRAVRIDALTHEPGHASAMGSADASRSAAGWMMQQA